LTEDGLGSLVTILILLALHAIITMAYAALTNSREHALREQTEPGSNVPPRLHITYQVSLLLIRFAIAAVTVSRLGGWLASRLQISSPATEQLVADVAVLLPIALLTLILGDLVPEAVGSTRADGIAPWAVYPMRLLILIFSPVTTVMLALSKSLASAFGSSNMVNVFTEEEIMTMLDASEKEGTIESEEKEMLYSVLEFGDTVVSELMIPRIDIVAVDIETPLEDALKAFIESGHSRIPVYEESIDEIKGLLYAKDLLNFWSKGDSELKPIREIMRKASFVPESKRADELLQELRISKVHMVIVVDEYGGTAGLVTFEDLIEEIVGDIQDEYDVHEEAEYTKISADNYLVEASINLDDFNDLLEVEIPTDDNNTLGGFLFAQFGRVPEIGEKIEYGNLILRIDTIEGRRIRKVRVIRKSPPLEDGSESLNNNLAPQPQPITD
jgi:putative hemolysin